MTTDAENLGRCWLPEALQHTTSNSSGSVGSDRQLGEFLENKRCAACHWCLLMFVHYPLRTTPSNPDVVNVTSRFPCSRSHKRNIWQSTLWVYHSKYQNQDHSLCSNSFRGWLIRTERVVRIMGKRGCRGNKNLNVLGGESIDRLNRHESTFKE